MSRRPEPCRRALWPAVAAFAVLTGCASDPPAWPRSYVVLLPDADGRTGEVTVEGAEGRTTLRAPGAAAATDGRPTPGPADARRLQADFGAAQAAQPVLPERYTLYFETGGTRLTAESQALMPRILARVRERAVLGMVDASVIGHTDTVGRAELNVRLSRERAQTVADLLRQAGLELGALAVEGHGETNPLMPTLDDTAEPRNRRVEVVLR